MPDYFTTGANNFHGRKRRFLNITGQFQIYQRKEFSLDNCNPNTTGLVISKWQLTIYFYLTYELGVELVIYWMLRLTICRTICVNFDSINFGNWLKMTFLCKWSGNYSLFYSITRTFDIYQLLYLWQLIREFHKWHLTIGNFHTWKFDSCFIDNNDLNWTVTSVISI